MRRPESVGLRPATATDLPLLQRIYCSTRQQELAHVDWPMPQKLAFLQQQFDLQHRYYHAHFPQGQFSIVHSHGEDVGRWYLHRAEAALRLIDVALLPAWRRKGIGSQLLHALMTEADACSRDIVLHVEANNPALAWYARLGFEPQRANGVYVELRRAACSAASGQCQ